MSTTPPQSRHARYRLSSRSAVPDFLPITLLGVRLHLTLRQAFLLLCGGSAAFQLWRDERLWLPLGRLAGLGHLLVPATVALLTVLVALLRPRGRPLERWLPLLWRFACTPRLLLWRPDASSEAPEAVPDQRTASATTPGTDRARRKGSVHRVQPRLVAARQVVDDVLCVRLPQQGRKRGTDYVAVLLLSGADTTLADEDVREQQAEQLRTLLATLSFPVQLLWRLLPLSEEHLLTPLAPLLAPHHAPGTAHSLLASPHTAEAEAEAMRRLVASAEQHHLHTLAQQHPLLLHRCYLIVRLAGQEVEASARAGQPFWRPRRRAALTLAQAHTVLSTRCEELARRLSGMQVAARRLRGPGELLPLYFSCLTALRAEHTPLSPSLLAGLERPVVRRRFVRSAATAVRDALGQAGAAAPLASQPSRAVLPSLPDLLSPAAVRIEADTLQLATEFARLLVVQQLPHEVAAGWLAPLASSPEPVEVSYHLRPLPAPWISAHLRRQLASYQSVLLMAEREGSLRDPAAAQAAAELEDLLARLEGQQDQMMALTWLLLVRGGSREELERRCARIQARLQQMGVLARVALFEQEAALRACLPQADCPLEAPLLLDSLALSSLLPFLPASILHRQGVLEGVTQADEPVVLARWHRRLPNAHRLILGKSGSGKSYHEKGSLLRLLLIEAARRALAQAGGQDQQVGVQAIVLDPEGEWGRLAHALGGEVIRLSAGAAQPLNPFALLLPEAAEGAGVEASGRLAEHLSYLHDLFDLMLADPTPEGRRGRLGHLHKGVLDQALLAIYAQAGISADPATHRRPPPHLAELDACLANREEPEAHELRARLHRYVSGSLSALFAGQGTLPLHAPLLVFDAQALEEDLRALGLFLVAHLVWQLARQVPRPRLLIVDEAASVLKHESGAHFLEELVRRARKHYLAVTLILHQADLLAGRQLAASCATHLLFGQEASAIAAVAELEGLSYQEQRVLARLGIGEALLVVGEQHRRLSSTVSPLAHLLISTHPGERQAWRHHLPGWVALSPLLADLFSQPQGPGARSATSAGEPQPGTNGHRPAQDVFPTMR